MTDIPALSGVFERVSAPTTFEETVARLGTAIRLGVLAPGARLPPERELAEQFGISRSTLRQALRTLTESGHLVALRGRTGGTFVSDEPPVSEGRKIPLEDESWRGMLDMRVAVELGATQLAAERGGPDDIAKLQTHTAAMRESDGDWAAFRRADVFFHLAVAEAARSPRLVAAMTEIHGQLSELYSHIPHPATALEVQTDQHAAIIDALRARDASEAVARMREHVQGTILLVEGLLP